MYEEIYEGFRNLTPENVEDFLSQVRTLAKEDSFGIPAVIRDIIDGFIPSVQDRYQGAKTQEDRSDLLMKAQVVAGYLLLYGQTSGQEFQQKYLLLLEILSLLSPRSTWMLSDKALDCLTGKVSSLGYTWLDITSNLSADILAYKITKEKSLTDGDCWDSFEKKGSLVIKDGEVRLSAYPETQSEGLVCPFSVCGERLKLYVKDSREERLKASKAGNINSIEAFISNFSTCQQSFRPSQKETLKKYSEGDRMSVRITGLDKDGNMLVSTIDPAFKTVKGHIMDETLVVGLNVSDLIPYLAEGNCIEDVLLDYMDSDEGVFSIYGAYVDYADKQANFARRNSTLFLAKAVNIYGTDRINWISYNGIGMISFYEPGIKVGDIRTMTVLNTKENNSGFYINAKIAGGPDALPGRSFNDDFVLHFFTKEYDHLKKDFVQPSIMKVADALNDGIIRSLATILLHSLHDGNSIEHYRRLSVSRVLYNLIDDTRKASFAMARAAFLKNCILFARGEALTFPERHIEDYEEDQKKVLSTLLCLGKQELEGALCSLLATVDQKSRLAKIARLILSKNTALLADNDLGYSDASLRREVASVLRVSDTVLDEDCADIPTGKYGNVERQFREFKSSYVYRNDDTGADFQTQGRDEIFQAVCGLLNSNGGQVYIGVNNNGDPIVDSSWGLAADIKWLKSNYVKVNALRKTAIGHNVPKVTDIDSFVNFLAEEKRIYFKDSVLDNIVIEPTDDMDAICIEVSPSEYEIAYLFKDHTHTDGQAFRRDGNRTIPMTEQEKQKRLMKLKSIDKEVVFQIKIQEAIDQQKKIILKSYESSDCRDRFLAPINLLYGGESVWCIDLEDRNKTCKQFRLSRAQDVEVVDEKYPHGKPKVESDIFRFTGEKNIHVKISLNIKAKNYLLEEYPEVANLTDKEFYQVGEGHDARWILDTRIVDVVGLRRFYIGLADKIEILETEDSEKIKENIQDFRKEYLDFLK